MSRKTILNARTALFAPLAALAMAMPAVATASSLYHPAGGEVGYTTHPDHLQGGKQRSDVLRDIEAARKDGSLALLARGYALPQRNTGTPKTREQVQREFLEMPAAEKQRLQEMHGG